MNKKSLRQLVLVGLVALYAFMGSACTRDQGADAINKALLSPSTVEQTIANHFCDADNVLSQCP